MEDCSCLASAAVNSASGFVPQKASQVSSGLLLVQEELDQVLAELKVGVSADVAEAVPEIPDRAEEAFGLEADVLVWLDDAQRRALTFELQHLEAQTALAEACRAMEKLRSEASPLEELLRFVQETKLELAALLTQSTETPACDVDPPDALPVDMPAFETSSDESPEPREDVDDGGSHMLRKGDSSTDAALPFEEAPAAMMRWQPRDVKAGNCTAAEYQSQVVKVLHLPNMGSAFPVDFKRYSNPEQLALGVSAAAPVVKRKTSSTPEYKKRPQKRVSRKPPVPATREVVSKRKHQACKSAALQDREMLEAKAAYGLARALKRRRCWRACSRWHLGANEQEVDPDSRHAWEAYVAESRRVVADLQVLWQKTPSQSKSPRLAKLHTVPETRCNAKLGSERSFMSRPRVRRNGVSEHRPILECVRRDGKRAEVNRASVAEALAYLSDDGRDAYLLLEPREARQRISMTFPWLTSRARNKLLHALHGNGSAASQCNTLGERCVSMSFPWMTSQARNKLLHALHGNGGPMSEASNDFNRERCCTFAAGERLATGAAAVTSFLLRLSYSRAALVETIQAKVVEAGGFTPVSKVAKQVYEAFPEFNRHGPVKHLLFGSKSLVYEQKTQRMPAIVRSAAAGGVGPGFRSLHETVQAWKASFYRRPQQHHRCTDGIGKRYKAHLSKSGARLSPKAKTMDSPSLEEKRCLAALAWAEKQACSGAMNFLLQLLSSSADEEDRTFAQTVSSSIVRISCSSGSTSEEQDAREPKDRSTKARKLPCQVPSARDCPVRDVFFAAYGWREQPQLTTERLAVQDTEWLPSLADQATVESHDEGKSALQFQSYHVLPPSDPGICFMLYHVSVVIKSCSES